MLQEFILNPMSLFFHFNRILPWLASSKKVEKAGTLIYKIQE